MVYTEIISGHALLGEALDERSVNIVITDGIIVAIEEEKRVPDIWICPAFFNAHTHLADTVAMDLPVTGTLIDLVTPPDGLKHQILRKTTDENLISAMKSSIQEIITSGTAGFADFREGGEKGVYLLKKALIDYTCHSIILGRKGGEQVSDGIGISSIRDDPDYLSIMPYIKDTKKILAFHAGEQDALDVDAAIGCQPDLLVHGTHLTADQISHIAEVKIPIAICARSNALLGVADDAHPPIQSFIDAGITIMIGTDNVMFVQPDMFQEMAYIHTRYHIDPHEIIRAAVNGSQLLHDNFFIIENKPPNLLLMDVSDTNLIYSRDLCSTLVKRGRKDLIRRIIINGVNKHF